MDLNRVTLIGRLGRDPESRTVQSGQTTVSFSVATSEKWKDQSGAQQERTTWHNISAWGDGICRVLMQYAKKGTRLYVEGSVRLRTYTTKEGVEKLAYEVHVGSGDRVILLDGARPRDAVRDEAPPPRLAREVLDDDIPF